MPKPLAKFHAGNIMLAFALVFLVLVAIFFYRNQAAYRAEARESDHIGRLLAENAAILSSLKDAETGQRGFLLTNDSRYLDNYQRALEEIPARLQTLHQLAADDPVEGPRAAELSSLANQKIAELRRTVDLMRAKGFDAAAREVQSHLGRNLMVEIRRVSRQIEEQERDRQSRSFAQLNAEAARGRLEVAVGSIGLFLLVAFASLAIRRDMAEQSRLMDELSRSRNEMEIRVRERTADLEVANKEMEAFSYSVSHDLSAPLRSIDGFSLIILEDYGDKFDAEGIQLLERIRASTRRMRHLIDDLLKLARVSRMEIRRETVSLSEIAESVLAELRRAHPGREVRTHVAADISAQGDPQLLCVVLENLLGNAWKFTSKNPAAQIWFGSLERDGSTVYYVRDNGAGFDMTYAGKLFAPFQRLHDDRDFDGTGVGLATVQRVIHRHHGRIWAESKPGEGAEFYFALG